MEDFNRINYVVNSAAKWRGLLILPLCMLFTFQMLLTNHVINLYNDNLLLSLFGYLLPAFSLFPLIGILHYFYVKSVGTVTNYAASVSSKAAGITVASIFLCGFLAAVGIFVSQLNFLIPLGFAIGVLCLPNFKTNMKYRKYVWGIAAATLFVGIFPLDRVFTFGTHFEQPITTAYLSEVTCLVLTGVCNHFALLKMLRPLRPESYQNSSASQDAILGDPSNLTILAVLANCQNADFVFLQKISQLDEANFNKQVYYMEQAGLLYVFQLPNGIFKNKLAAKISRLGWQVVTRIYNETMAAPPQPNQALTYYR